MVATTTEEPETKITATIIITKKEGSVTDHVSC